jgi:co-chaperonin GroES (HSP10)
MTAMRLRPDTVLVKLAPTAEQRRDSGIVLVRAVAPVVTSGKVVQVGDDVQDVQVGDFVTFSPMVGEPAPGPTPHLFIREEDIDTVIEVV